MLFKYTHDHSLCSLHNALAHTSTHTCTHPSSQAQNLQFSYLLIDNHSQHSSSISLQMLLRRYGLESVSACSKALHISRKKKEGSIYSFPDTVVCNRTLNAGYGKHIDWGRRSYYASSVSSTTSGTIERSSAISSPSSNSWL